jgi:hypothetical protein
MVKEMAWKSNVSKTSSQIKSEADTFLADKRLEGKNFKEINNIVKKTKEDKDILKDEIGKDLLDTLTSWKWLKIVKGDMLSYMNLLLPKWYNIHYNTEADDIHYNKETDDIHESVYIYLNKDGGALYLQDNGRKKHIGDEQRKFGGKVKMGDILTWNWVVYMVIVKKGDTLWKIAKKRWITINDWKKWAHSIKEGQKVQFITNKWKWELRVNGKLLWTFDPIGAESIVKGKLPQNQVKKTVVDKRKWATRSWVEEEVSNPMNTKSVVIEKKKKLVPKKKSVVAKKSVTSSVPVIKSDSVKKVGQNTGSVGTYDELLHLMGEDAQPSTNSISIKKDTVKVKKAVKTKIEKWEVSQGKIPKITLNEEAYLKNMKKSVPLSEIFQSSKGWKYPKLDTGENVSSSQTLKWDDTYNIGDSDQPLPNIVPVKEDTVKVRKVVKPKVEASKPEFVKLKSGQNQIPDITLVEPPVSDESDVLKTLWLGVDDLPKFPSHYTNQNNISIIDEANKSSPRSVVFKNNDSNSWVEDKKASEAVQANGEVDTILNMQKIEPDFPTGNTIQGDGVVPAGNTQAIKNSEKVPSEDNKSGWFKAFLKGLWEKTDQSDDVKEPPVVKSVVKPVVKLVVSEEEPVKNIVDDPPSVWQWLQDAFDIPWDPGKATWSKNAFDKKVKVDSKKVTWSRGAFGPEDTPDNSEVPNSINIEKKTNSWWDWGTTSNKKKKQKTKATWSRGAFD